MIRLRRLTDEVFVLNADLVQEIEATPDTIITLISGKKMMVKESVDEVVAAVLEYRRSIVAGTDFSDRK
ncbi:MAG: flagellar FlbD family protein [Candidatus Hydrogenedentota bacterium]